MAKTTHTAHEHKETVANERRRAFLVAGAAGVGAFILGKVLGPSLTFFAPEHTVADFKNFRIVDSEDEMRLFDKLGNEIVIIEKEGFTN